MRRGFVFLSWFGIRCNGDGSADDAIGLGANNLTGNLPKEIGDFPSLTALSLFGNAIGGAIPAQAGNLTKLDRLELYSNLRRRRCREHRSDLHGERRGRYRHPGETDHERIHGWPR